MNTPPKIVVDTREQVPWFQELDTVSQKLDAGDYSLEGLTDLVSVERKSKADAYGSAGKNGRARFIECLERLAELDRACIVIEADMVDFCTPPPFTKLGAPQAVGSYLSWCCMYNIPVLWAGPRDMAQRVALKYLLAYFKHRAEIAVANQDAVQRFVRIH